MKGKDIVVIGIQPWDIEIGSNCKNIAEVFSKENRVLYVNTPLDRKSGFTERHTAKIKKRKAVIRGKEPAIEQIHKGLWVFNPRTTLESINILPDGWLFDRMNWVNNHRLSKEIRWAVHELGFGRFILFNDSSMFTGFFQKELLKPELYIYYMRDYLIRNPFWRKHGVRLEPQLIRKADVVVTNSLLYTEYGLKFNPRSFMVGQGCDIEAFDESRVTIDIPVELQQVNRPIIGYVGYLSSRRLDVPLLETISEARPEWSFYLVGPEDEVFKSSRLHSQSNVHFPGARKPEALPGYIKGFDVCLNPQLINDATMGNYPRKIDEYLAMGKPVVASATKAMEYFGGHVSLGVGAEEYLQLIGEALSGDSPESRMKRKEFAKQHSWDHNVQAIYHAIEIVMNEQKQPLSNPTKEGSGLKARLKSNPRLKKFAMWMITPKRRPRPRWLIRVLVNRFFHKRGKHSLIRKPARIDVFPYHRFELGENSTIESFSVVNNGAGPVLIGSRVRIGIGSVVIGPVTMGNGSGLGQHVFVSGFNHGYQDGTKNSSLQPLDIRPVTIGEDSHIGANAVVLAGCHIGKRCQVGAGSVVTRDIPDFSIAVGNPARVIKRYNAETGKWEKFTE